MTGNIGEWSELYTLFKLLADGKLYAADADTNKIPSIYYDVLKVLRAEKTVNLEYCREAEIRVINADSDVEICSVPIAAFVAQTDKLLAEMRSKNGAKGALSCPKYGHLRNQLSAKV